MRVASSPEASRRARRGLKALLLAAALTLSACAPNGSRAEPTPEAGRDSSSDALDAPSAGTSSASPAESATATADARTSATRPTAGTMPLASTRPLAVRTIASGLRVPWEVAVAPGGRVFVTQRDTAVVGELRAGQVHPIRRFPEARPAGEGGLLGMAASPTFAQDGLLYMYFTAEADNRVMRFSVRDPGRLTPVVTGVPKAGNHNGGRIGFGPDGMLYIGTGDAARPATAQDRRSLGGKILRVKPDGGVPAGNPFPGSPVWSLGHRNVQGLDWDAKGRLWAAELGPDRDDEINLIVRGGNYGWPTVTGAVARDGYRAAAAVKQPPEAAWSGLVFLPGSAFPEWGDSLVAAGLRGRRLWRFPITADGRLGPGVAMFTGQYGRLRAAVSAADGSLWFTTSNHDGRGTPAPSDDRILRYGR